MTLSLFQIVSHLDAGRQTDLNALSSSSFMLYIAYANNEVRNLSGLSTKKRVVKPNQRVTRKSGETRKNNGLVEVVVQENVFC